MATKKFKCKVCGYVHEGDAAPAKCPVCQAPASEFVEEVEATAAEKSVNKKKGIDTNSNVYTIIYASVVVVIVATLLAVFSQLLAPQSEANVRIDKKSQILAALNLRGLEKTEIENKYAEVVVADRIIKSDASVINEGVDKDKAAFAMANKDITPDNLPIYVCTVNGETKYVIPLVGKGLWNEIWGYISLNDDKNTVYGAYFSHAGETAGLGARITEYEGFQQQFENKKVLTEDASDVALSVVKVGKKVEGLSADSRCDAITGATLTSDGVNNMVRDCLKKYMIFLTSNE